MFFSHDVLFKNGPLALVWMAGNDEFQTKNRRNKHYVLMLQADVSELAEMIRKYLPEMGTAHGLSLKKTSILVKGLSLIHLHRIQSLARRMYETRARMQSVNIRVLQEIDLPVERTPAQSRHNNGRDTPTHQLSFGFGDLNEFGDLLQVMNDVGPRCFRTNTAIPPQLRQRAIASPLPEPEEQNNMSRDQRSSEEEGTFREEHVLRRLEEVVSRNPNAHSIRENDAIRLQPPNFEGWFNDFGDNNAGFEDFLMAENEQAVEVSAMEVGEGERGGVTEPEITDMVNVEDRNLLSPIPGPSTISTRANLDDAAGRHGRMDVRRPIASDDEEEDSVVMNTQDRQQLELDTLIVVERQQKQQKRLRLDEEPQISLHTIQAQIKGQKRPLDYEFCFEELNDGRKNRLKLKMKKVALDQVLEKASGRQMLMGTRLKAFVSEMHDMAGRPEAKSRPRRERGDKTTTRPAAPEVSAARQERTTPLPNSVSDFGQPQPSHHDTDYAPLSPPQAPPPPQYSQSPQADISAPQYEHEPPQIVVEPASPELEPPGLEQLRTGRVSFRELFPPGQISKKKAAMGFFQLLRMQSLQTVVMEQDEPFGEIYITKT